jgi:hypothetical protein
MRKDELLFQIRHILIISGQYSSVYIMSGENKHIFFWNFAILPGRRQKNEGPEPNI